MSLMICMMAMKWWRSGKKEGESSLFLKNFFSKNFKKSVDKPADL